MPLGAKITGGLDADALDRAFAAVVARHEALRTTFGSDDGHPVQLVAPSLALSLERIDLRGEADPAAAAQARVDRLCSTPLDLATGPLVRGLLAQTADDEHVFELVFSSHHLRRLVPRRRLPRDRRLLPRLRRGRGALAAAPALAVHGVRPRRAGPLRRARYRGRGRAVARAARRRPRRPRASDRPAAPAGPELSRARPTGPRSIRSWRSRCANSPAPREGDAVRDAALRLLHAARPAQRPGRRRRRDHHLRPRPFRARGRDRPVREHGRPAR